MAGNRTLTIIKPDAFGSAKAGKILAHLEAGGFRVAAARVTHLTEAEAGAFYEVHRERPFFRSLIRSARRSPSRVSNQLASSPPSGVAVRNGSALPAGPENSSTGVASREGSALAVAPRRRAGKRTRIGEIYRLLPVNR